MSFSRCGVSVAWASRRPGASRSPSRKIRFSVGLMGSRSVLHDVVAGRGSPELLGTGAVEGIARVVHGKQRRKREAGEGDLPGGDARTGGSERYRGQLGRAVVDGESAARRGG